MNYDVETINSLVLDFKELVKHAVIRVNIKETIRGDYHSYDENDFEEFYDNCISFRSEVSYCSCCSPDVENASISFNDLCIPLDVFRSNVEEEVEKRKRLKEIELEEKARLIKEREVQQEKELYEKLRNKFEGD